MIILGDSNITDATITATNTLSFAPEEKLQIYELVDKFKASQGVTRIVLDYGATVSDINAIALCGTNISDSATLSLSYSSTSPDSPEATISLPSWSSFSQVWVLGACYEKRYWMIDIDDPAPQGDDSTGVEIGYIYAGEYIAVDAPAFPITPALNLVSKQSTSATDQEYGSKQYNKTSASFTAYFDETELLAFFEIVKARQNIDPVLLVPFEDSISNTLYPPLYCKLTSTSYGYPQDTHPGAYAIDITVEETF